MDLASLHANRLAEKPPWGGHIGTQRREAGWERVLRTKARLSRRVGWLADYFIQPTDIFLSVSYVPDTGPGTEDTYTDKSWYSCEEDRLGVEVTDA